MKCSKQTELPSLRAMLVNIYGECIVTWARSHGLTGLLAFIYCCSYVKNTVPEKHLSQDWWRNWKMKKGTCKQQVNSEQEFKKQVWLWMKRWGKLAGPQWLSVKRSALISEPEAEMACMHVFQKRFPRVPFETSSATAWASPLWPMSAKPPGG